MAKYSLYRVLILVFVLIICVVHNCHLVLISYVPLEYHIHGATIILFNISVPTIWQMVYTSFFSHV